MRLGISVAPTGPPERTSRSVRTSWPHFRLVSVAVSPTTCLTLRWVVVLGRAWYDVLVKPVEASYENGMLKPAKALPLTEGEHVRVIVVRRPDPRRWDLTRIAAVVDDEDVLLAEAGRDEWASELWTSPVRAAWWRDSRA